MVSYLTVSFAVFEAIPVIFISTHGFNIGQSGLVFIGVGVGTGPNGASESTAKHTEGGCAR